MAIPILIRLSLFLIVPVIHWSFETLAHHGIHLASHKIEMLKKFETRFKHLPDILMLLALVVLHFVEVSTE